MKKDLTTSELDRQNILNNPYALSEIEKATGIQGIPFEGKTVVLKDQAASFFEASSRTIENSWMITKQISLWALKKGRVVIVIKFMLFTLHLIDTKYEMGG